MFRHLCPSPARQRPALAAVLLLAAALLWAQLLGLAHGVRHAGLAGPAGHAAHAVQGVPHGQATVAGSAAAQAAPGLLAHLQAPAEEGGECRLYDQLGQGGPLAWPLSLPAWPLPPLAAWAVLLRPVPAPCLAFAARAPPLFR